MSYITFKYRAFSSLIDHKLSILRNRFGVGDTTETRVFLAVSFCSLIFIALVCAERIVTSLFRFLQILY